VSATACEALTLVVVGYIIGVGATFALTTSVEPSIACNSRRLFRYREMRTAGFSIMALGAASQLLAAVLGRGTTYGANQLQYGLPSIFGSGADTALLVGLILVTVTSSHTIQHDRLWTLLRRREWAVLSIYLLAVAVTGDRAGLIAPVVYMAWVYSTHVQVIALKWIMAGLLLTLIAGTIISNYRHNNDLSAGSPGIIIQNAAGDVSSSAWLTQQTVLHVPSTENYMHGSTYLAALESQLPGPLARAVGAPTRTASAVFRNIIGFYDPNQGFAESFPSEAYLNFGLIGCLGAGIFLGALMGWAWQRHQALARRPRDLLYPVLLAGLVYGFRSDALTQIKDALYPMTAVWLLMTWYRMRPTVATGVPASVLRHQTPDAIVGRQAN
jgi:hypothetical protein